MKKSARFLALPLALVIAAGCAARRPADVPAADSLAPPSPYVRTAGDGSNSVHLRIALREFLPKRKGPAVWLCAVSHIGESNYYAAVQRELDARTIVLFEGISAARYDRSNVGHDVRSAPDRNQPGPGGHDVQNAPVPPPRLSSTSSHDGTLQSTMAKSLGLVFQLEAIDYNRKNFQNSDLTIQELRQVLAGAPEKPGAGSAAQGFESLMAVLQGDSWFSAVVQLGLRFVSVSPKLQAMGRLMLVDLLGEIQGDPAQLGNLPPDMKQLLEVLVQRRNQKVIADLELELPKLSRRDSVAVLYGAGHMPDLERRLRGQLRYRPAREIWLTAFGVHLAKSGVTDSERQWIEGLIKSQLQMMRPSGSPTKQ